MTIANNSQNTKNLIMNTFIDQSPAHFASTSSSSPTSPPRVALVPLQNHTYPSSSKSSKQESTIFYPPFPKHQQRIPRISFKNVSTFQDDASLMPSTSSTAPTSTAPPTTTTPIPNDNNDDVKRAKFLAKFDYVHMRSRWTRVELAKMPSLNEDGVLFHSPAVPSVTYNTIFQTTHDFLDLSITLHMYPTFVDLPLHLRPSKARYDATKQSENQSFHVRCLFCRGRFGGKHAKAIWERHVKEHWPKQGESTDASPIPSTSFTAPTSTAPPTTTMPIPNDNNDNVERATFLAEFNYVDMRSRLTRVELAKIPYLNEAGVLFHSPAVPSVTYNTVFQTTHDFLELGITLHMHPTFVDLPFHLRPSKARYDATKQSEDQMLRVRCLFCRGRFGGKNAKAIWERHVKEHWPKQGESTIPTPRRHHEPLSGEAQQDLLKWVDHNKEYPKEKTRRPMRQIQKRPTGSLQLS